MNLKIITPDDSTLYFTIEDFAPISEGKKTTEIMLIVLNEDDTDALANALIYHSIEVTKNTDNLGVIVNKPKNMRSTPEELILDYKI